VSWVPAEVVLKTVAQQRQVLSQEEARIAQFAEYHTAERAKLVEQKKQAEHDLGQALLPSLDPPAIARAAETTGLVGLPGEDIPAKVRGRRAWLRGRITEIERDRRYVDRELLRHPHTGSLTRAIAEATDMREPSVAVIATCEGHVRFARLFEIGFDAPEFRAPWWRYSYWEDRWAADAIVALFPGKKAFAEVRKEYESAKETLAVFDADLARLRAEVAAIDALAREHAQLVDEHAHLDERALTHTRGRLIEHLLTSDASLVSQRLEPTSALRLLFLRASGIAAKISYLDGIERANLAALQKDLAAERQKIDNVEQKTRKRWAPMDAARFTKLAVDRRPRYEKRWQRIGKVYDTVYRYDRYDRGRYYDDLLWWDIMTRGRYDGTFMPEVAGFYQSHPDYRFDPDYKALAAAQADERAREAELDDDAEAAAAGIDADSDAGDGADLGQVDAS
jgi:hypothetical protein